MKLFALGNALVDDEVTVDDALLSELGLDKGHVKLIDETELYACRASIKALKRSGGGSAANSCAAFAGFGGEAHFCGRVGDDEVGNWFLEDIRRYGVSVKQSGASNPGTSGQCLVLITPDAQRTMLTYLGVATNLREQDIDESALARSDQVYLEGYLASSATSVETCRAALDIARKSSCEISVSLSDSSMVMHFRSGLEALLEGGVKQIFCNLDEALLFAETDRLDVAVSKLKEAATRVHITMGAEGSLYATREAQTQAQPKSTEAVDTTGAGDMYAGAALYAQARGWDARATVEFANRAAAQIVRIYGARLPDAKHYSRLVDADRLLKPPASAKTHLLGH